MKHCDSVTARDISHLSIASGTSDSLWSDSLSSRSPEDAPITMSKGSGAGDADPCLPSTRAIDALHTAEPFPCASGFSIPGASESWLTRRLVGEFEVSEG